MLRDVQQLRFSEYANLYDLIIPSDDILRRIKENVDFTFVRETLRQKYSREMGRDAVDPVVLFKMLFLKMMFKVSDRQLVRRTTTDMSFKYFLDLNPEDAVVDHSMLSKFRRLRLKDTDLLDLLLSKSVSMAISKGVISRENDLIVDATHTVSHFRAHSLESYLRDLRRSLLKCCLPVAGEGFVAQLPKEPGKDADAEEWASHCRALVSAIASGGYSGHPAIEDRLSLLEEALEDIEELGRTYMSEDKDAKKGSKGKGKGFFGYKTHIGITKEGIIAAATVTSGEVSDGGQLEELNSQAAKRGLAIKHDIGDAAYASAENIEALDTGKPEEERVRIVAPVNPIITQGQNRDEKTGFHYNKDADTYVCPAGELAYKKTYEKCKEKKRDENGRVVRKFKNARMVYYFDVDKCSKCPLREGCYKGKKTKTYMVTILSDAHREQTEYEKTEEFRQLMRHRYKIEATNANLKQNTGMDKTISSGLRSMTIQAAMSMFVVNIKKIVKYEG